MVIACVSSINESEIAWSPPKGIRVVFLSPIDADIVKMKHA